MADPWAHGFERKFGTKFGSRLIACSRQREQLTLKSVMQTWSRRCLRRPKLDFSDYFLSCLGAREITVISVCRDQASKDLKSVSETSKIQLGRSR
ncbi:hypothetical protein CRG98_018783 [Punica granatum]|uniref:Uncharacterized protein n=1 Tax=Punica granatum TaxID=22663 RepID=A0A2I0JWW1_PUNGR|nr:hypothetical protein CRG98_018783 [Punica granatum]